MAVASSYPNHITILKFYIPFKLRRGGRTGNIFHHYRRDRIYIISKQKPIAGCSKEMGDQLRTGGVISKFYFLRYYLLGTKTHKVIGRIKPEPNIQIGPDPVYFAVIVYK